MIFKNLIDNEAKEENIIEYKEKAYFAAKKMFPNGMTLSCPQHNTDE
jgi:hypothetical protein